MEKPTMAGYILDQGRALRQSFAERACFVDPMIELFQNQDIRKVYFLGSGTSYHAALSFKNWFEKFLKVEAEVVIPTVFTNYTQINNLSLIHILVIDPDLKVTRFQRNRIFYTGSRLELSTSQPSTLKTRLFTLKKDPEVSGDRKSVV